MGEKNLRFFIVCFLIILIAGIVSASFTFGAPRHSIKTEYEPGEKVLGWISIKLTNESNFTLFEDSEENSIDLIDLIDQNLNFNYSVDSEGNLSTIDFQDLYLDNGTFYLPTTTGTITYQLNFSGTEVFTEEINISLAATEDLNAILNNKIATLANVKTSIGTHDSFSQISINSVLNITSLETELGKLSAAYVSANTQEKLDEISTNLSLMKIPENLAISTTAISIPVISKSENIDLDLLINFTNSTYESEDEEDYKTAIVGWNINNLNVRITFNEFSVRYNGINTPIVSIFDLEINKTNTSDYPMYLFVEKTDNTLFKQDYQEQEQGNYYVFDLTEDAEIISFSTTEDIDFSELAFFISPALVELNVEDFEYQGEEEQDLEDRKKKLIFALMVTLVFIGGFVLYLVLQVWYKKRYENYLFNNKNDLYNLANYITNAKRRGLDNNQISENLKKSQWNSEQIRYALRKYSGKRTGMYEIPLGKVLEKKEQKGSKRYGYGGYP